MRPSGPVYVPGVWIPLGAFEFVNGCGTFEIDNDLLVEEPKAPVADAACFLFGVDEKLGPGVEENGASVPAGAPNALVDGSRCWLAGNLVWFEFGNDLVTPPLPVPLPPAACCSPLSCPTASIITLRPCPSTSPSSPPSLQILPCRTSPCTHPSSCPIPSATDGSSQIASHAPFPKRYPIPEGKPKLFPGINCRLCEDRNVETSWYAEGAGDGGDGGSVARRGGGGRSRLERG